MKTKWNWLDTTIVCLVVALIVGVCIFLFRPDSNDVISHTESDFLITFDTEKAKAGTYDALKAGDVVYIVDSDKEVGVIESVEMLPHKTAVFNEQTKQYSVAENTQYPICRVIVRVQGYKNDSNEIYTQERAVVFDEEWFMETDTFRFAAKVSGVKGAEQTK